MPPRRKSVYGDVESASNDLQLEQNIQSLLAPQRTTVLDLPIGRIRPNPFQARRTFDGLDELALAISTHGFVTRLRVRPDPEAPTFFQLVFGERRLRAAQLAGLATIPCELGEYDDTALIEIGLAENIQRRDLVPLEEAEAFRNLLDTRSYTHEQLAERIGKYRSYVEDRLALLRVPEDVQAMVTRRPDTLRAAREIAKLPTEQARRTLIEGVTSGALSQHDVRTLVREAVTAPVEEQSAGETTPDEEIGRQGVAAETIQDTVDDMPHPRAVQAAATQRSRFQVALERDAGMLQVMYARWRQALPRLSLGERSQLKETLHTNRANIEQLLQALDTASE